MEHAVVNYDAGNGKFQGETVSFTTVHRFIVGLTLTLVACAGMLLFARPLPDSEQGPKSQRALAAAVVMRDQLLSSELDDAVATAADAARLILSDTTDANNQPSLDHLLTRGELERFIMVRRGDSVIALAGSQRVTPLPAYSVVALYRSAFEHALVVNYREGSLTVTVGLLLDAVRGIPGAGASLAGLSSGSMKLRWKWDSLSIPATFGSRAEALQQVSAMMHPVPPTFTEWNDFRVWLRQRQLTAFLLAIAVVWLLIGPSFTVRWLGVALPLAAILILHGFPNTSGSRAAATGLLGASLLALAVPWWSRRHPAALPLRLLSSVGVVMMPLVAFSLARWLLRLEESNSIVAWFGWQLSLAFLLTALLALLVATWRSATMRRLDNRWAVLALLFSLACGVAGIEAWYPEAGWQFWYLPLIAAGSAVVLLPVSRSTGIVMIVVVAATLAALATWGASLERRMEWVRSDLVRLSAGVDSTAVRALEEFMVTAQIEHTARLDQLYAAWSNSEIATLGVPTHLAIGDGKDHWTETVALDSLAITWDDLNSLTAVAATHPFPSAIHRGGVQYRALVLPFAPDTIVTVTIAPRTQLIAPTRFGRLVGWRDDNGAGYTLVAVESKTEPTNQFGRRGRFLRAMMRIGGPEDGTVVRAVIEMSRPQPFAVRTALVILLDAGVLFGLWVLLQRTMGLRDAAARSVLQRSHRRMVAAALAAFFMVSSVVFTLWSVVRLRQEAERQRVSEMTRTLAEIEAYQDRITPVTSQIGEPISDSAGFSLGRVAENVDAELGMYRDEKVIAASSSMLVALGVFPSRLPPGTARAATSSGNQAIPAPPQAPYRLGVKETGVGAMMVAAIPGGDPELAREQTDLLLLLLLTTISGGLAAVFVAERVARALGRPIDQLARTAIAIGRGEHPPVPNDQREIPIEFAPVFGAIAQMEEDLRTSEAERAAASAQTAKVVAWGEMARQVAHEIKNPLTPMRLGLQHLRRLQNDGRPNFGAQVTETSERLLVEVERLDRIARAFAHYGSPPPDSAPLEPVDLRKTLDEVVELFALTFAAPIVTVEGEGGGLVICRREELIQVVLNLLDNSRQAGASKVQLVTSPGVLEVIDNGSGIPADQLERIFEPTFSTNTSGTGLGLAIVKRLVAGWGAEVSVVSTMGSGTTIDLRFSSGT